MYNKMCLIKVFHYRGYTKSDL